MLDPRAPRSPDRSSDYHASQLIMPVDAVLVVHITAGSLALATGYVALFAGKGGSVHRRNGRFFVYAMAVMGVTATLIALARGIKGSVGGGPFVLYFVVTAVATVRPRGAASRWIEVSGLVIAGVLAVANFMLGMEAVRLGGVRDGVPAGMTFSLAAVLPFAAIGDIRVMRFGSLTGARRIARHLWRMCFAMFIAAGSFFLGQADEFPQALRHPALIVPPAIAPLIALIYWMWRVRVRRSLRGMVRLTEPVPGTVVPAAGD
jgi:uncharacterized membrane protein